MGGNTENKVPIDYKRNIKMNFTKLAIATFVASTLMATTSVTYANESFKIEGATETLPSGCSFLNVQDGTMAWDEANGIWYTTGDGQVRVKTRDVISVVVDNNKKLQDAQGDADNLVDVAYDQSSLTWENPRKSPTSAVGGNDFTVQNLEGGNVLNLKIDHTLTTSDSYVAESNTNYHLVNVVTCNI